MASQGSVIARVYTSDAYLPLRNVPVAFTQTNEAGKETLLAVRFTNSSGLTDPVTLETPDASDSLSPGYSPRPYATVNIRASFPGYNSIDAMDVQVFPNVETIQGIQLRPVSPADRDETIIYPGSTQNL